MIDIQTADRIEEILHGSENREVSDITPDKELSEKLCEKFKSFNVETLCIIHSFAENELSKRGIEISPEEEEYDETFEL